MRSDAQPVARAAANGPRGMRRIAFTALAGTSIEWFDFFLYGTAAALIFPAVFFAADMPPYVSLIASFGSFAVGFLARPLGGLVFGHIGDRVGRKAALVGAMLMMGIATTLIGLLPGHASIGIAAPLLLVLLRFLQGLAVGGQWGGAMLLVTENAPPERRGFYGAFAQAGAPLGLILANLAFLATASQMSDAAFMAWGWRLPFLASILLIVLSLYVQLRLEETPAFCALQAQRAQAAAGSPAPTRSPVFRVLRQHPREILLAAGAFLAIQVTFYIVIAFAIAYGSNPVGLGLPKQTMLAAVLIGSAVLVPALFLSAHWSDRHGRRGIYMLGAALLGVWAFALFPLIDSGDFLLITLAVSVAQVLIGLMYGPQAALLSELFAAEVRYSGASLGYQLGAVLGGALAPMLATAMLAAFDSTLGIALYISVACLISLVCVRRLSGTARH